MPQWTSSFPIPGSFGARAGGAGVLLVRAEGVTELHVYNVDHAVDTDEATSQAWWCHRRGFPIDAAGNVRGWTTPTTRVTGQLLPTSYMGVSTSAFGGAKWPRFSFVGADAARTADGRPWLFDRFRHHLQHLNQPNRTTTQWRAVGATADLELGLVVDDAADVTLTIGGLTRPESDDVVVFFLRGSGPYTAWYRIGWDVDASGQARGGWSADKPVSGSFAATGLAVAVVRRGAARHLVFYTIEATARGPVGRHRIGYDVDVNGDVQRWGPWVRTPGEIAGTLCGLSIAVGDVSGDGKPDLVVLRVVDDGGTKATYQLGLDLFDLGAVVSADAPLPLPSVFDRPPIAAASWGEGRLDLVGVAGERVYQKSFDQGRWSPDATGWSSLGGAFVGPPRAISWGHGRLDLVGVGRDGAMYQKAWDGARWWPSADGWSSLGGRFASPPTVASWAANRLDLLGLAPDGQLFQKTWDGARWLPSVDGWSSLGGRFVHPVAAVCRAADTLEIFGVGADAGMWSKAWWKSSWSPGGGDWVSLGGRFISAPAATSWGIGRIDVVGVGTDGAIWHKTWDSNRWWPSPDGWSSLGGRFVSAPSIVTLGPGSLHVVGLGVDQSLHHNWWNGSAWSGWRPLGGVFTAAPVAIARSGRVDVFGLGTDGAMYQRWWTPAQGWQPALWTSLGGVFSVL